MEKPLQEWVSFKDAGIQVASPVAIGKEQFSMLNEARSARDELLQLYAFPEEPTDANYVLARKRAADNYIYNREQAVIDAAEDLARYGRGISAREVRSVLESNIEDLPNVEDIALESLAADNLREEALEDNPELVTQELVQDTGVADTIAKSQLTYKKYKDVEEGVPSMFSMEGLKTVLVDLIPMSDSMLNAAMVLNEKAGWQALWTSAPQAAIWGSLFSEDVRKRIAEAATPNERLKYLYNMHIVLGSTMTKEQYSAYLDYLQANFEENGWSKERQRRFWAAMSFGGSMMEDWTLAGDVAAYGREGVKMIKNLWQSVRGGNLSSFLKAPLLSGNKKKAQQIAKETLDKLNSAAENTESHVTEDALEFVGDAAFHPNRAINTTFGESMQKDVQEAVARAKTFGERLKIIENDPWTTAEKDAVAKATEAKALETLFPGDNQRKQFVEINTVKNEDGTRDVVITMGHGKDGIARFISPEAAEEFMAKNSKYLPGEYNVIQDGEGYLVNIRTRIPDPGVTYNTTYNNEWKHYGLLKYAFGRIFQPDEVHDASIVYDSGTRVVKNTIRKEFKKTLKKLDKKQLIELDSVVQQGQVNRKWYTNEWLKNAGFSDDQVSAYNMYRDNEDFNYVIYNNYVRRQLTNSGERFITYKGIDGDETFIGKQQIDFDRPERYVFRDTTTNSKINLGEMSKDKIKQMQDEGKVFIKLRKAVKDTDGVAYNVLITTRDGVNSAELPQYIVPYVAGGRTYYPKGTVFLKEVIAGEANGVTSVYHPRTLGAGLDKPAEIQKANEINEVKELYREYKHGALNKEEIDAIINDATAGNEFFRVEGLKAFEEMLEENGGPLNWRYNTEVCEDGQVMKQIQTMLRKGAVEIEEAATDAFEDGFDLIMDYTKSLIKHRGQNQLMTAVGNATKTLNFLESVEETAEITSNLMIRKAYDKTYANELKRVFHSIIDERYLREQQSDRSFIQNMRLASDINRSDPETAAMISNLKYAIERYEIATHAPTAADKWFNRTMTSLANTIADSDLSKHLPILQRNGWAYKYISGLNPIQFGKVVAYQMFLGALSPRQLWMQALGTKAVYDLEPKNALKASSVYIPATTALMTDDPEKLAYIAKKASKLGMDEDTFLGMVDFLKMMGCKNGVESAYTGYAGYARNQILNFSTSFARAGEEVNDTMAAMVAFIKNHDELVKAGFKPGMKSIPDEVMKILRETAGLKDDLYKNMSKVNDTSLSRIGGVDFLAQFQNYSLNSLQLFFNKRFSAGQKTILLLSDLIAYGVRGTVAPEAGFMLYDYLNDNGISPETAYGFEAGLPAYIFKAFDRDVDVTSGGPSVLGPWSKMYRLFYSGDSSVIDEIPQSSAFKILWNTGNLFAQSARLIMDSIRPDQDPMQLDRDLYQLIKIPQPSSLSRIEKAFLAYRTGIFVNSRGDIVKWKTKPGDAIAYGLGVDTSSQYGTNYLYWHGKKEDEVVKGLMEGLRNSYKDWQMTGSEDLAEVFFSKLRTYTNGNEVNESIRRKVLEQTYYMIKSNMYNTQQQRQVLKIFNKGRNFPDVANALNRPDVNIEGK